MVNLSILTLFYSIQNSLKDEFFKNLVVLFTLSLNSKIFVKRVTKTITQIKSLLLNRFLRGDKVNKFIYLYQQEAFKIFVFICFKKVIYFLIFKY